MISRKIKGFTLIELLVVIAIIGLLASIVMIALQKARDRSKDSRRSTTRNQVRSALQLYYSDYTSFPSTGGVWICLGTGTGDSCWNGVYSGSNYIRTALTPYLSSTSYNNLNGQAIPGTFAYNHFLYNFQVPANGLAAGSPAGAYLVWYKSVPFAPGECNSPIAPANLDIYWYCYELLGTP